MKPFAGRLSVWHSSASEGLSQLPLPLGPSFGLCKVGVAKIGTVKPGIAKVGTAKVGLCKVGNSKVGTAEVGIDELGTAKVGIAKVGFDKSGASKAGTPKVGAEQGQNRIALGKSGDIRPAPYTKRSNSPLRLASSLPNTVRVCARASNATALSGPGRSFFS